jgi:hypothetical protein
VSNEAGNLDDLSKFLMSAESGDYIFRESESGADMYIIRNGQVEILKLRAGGEKQLMILEAGDFFGEMSLLEDQPREVSARALGPVELLRIDATTFNTIVQEAPEIPVRMLRKLCLRLREYQEHDERAAAIAMGPLSGVSPSFSAASVSGAIPAHTPEPEAEPEAAASDGLAVLIDPKSQKMFELTNKGESTIGRVDRLTGFTPDVDLSAMDTQRTLSRRHAKIVFHDHDYFVREEIGTRNGTFVNGERVQTGVDVKLATGDRVRFGMIETVFEIR